MSLGIYLEKRHIRGLGGGPTQYTVWTIVFLVILLWFPPSLYSCTLILRWRLLRMLNVLADE
jgi:hypothetical protein